MAISRIRSPATAVLAILVVGVTGAVLVYRSGDRIREQDRAAYLAWERGAAAAVERATDLHQSLPGLAERVRVAADGSVPDEVRTMLARTRLTLERAQQGMLDVQVPTILQATVALYLEGVMRDLQAVSRLDEAADSSAPAEALAAYEAAFQEADQRYAEAEAARARLRDRLRLGEE